MTPGITLMFLLALLPARVTADPLTQEAAAAYAAKDWARAEQAYRALAQNKTSDATVQFRLGNTLTRQGRLDEAAAAYQEALARNPELAKAYHNLALIRLLQAEVALETAHTKYSTSDPNKDGMRRLYVEVLKLTRFPVADITAPPARTP